MTDTQSAPPCPRCAARMVPSDPADPVAEDFSWACPQCGALFAANDMDEELLVEPDVTPLATITDREGKAYHVSGSGDAQWFELTVRDEQAVAATVSVSWINAPTLVLAQLSVAPSYQQSGLAEPIIAELVALACRQGSTTIRGVVVDTELQATPDLLDWYAATGFDVVLAPAGGHVAATVTRAVTPDDCRSRGSG